jgi:hypothetical protein
MSETPLRPARSRRPIADPDLVLSHSTVDDAADTTVDGLEPVDAGLDLADDPFDDDLAGQLRAKAPLAVTRVTVILAGLVLVVGGFLGGVLVQKNFGSTATTANRTGNNFPAALASRGAGGNFTGRGGTGGTGGSTAAPATTGKITLVDGSTVYITTDAGDVVIVKTNASTAVQSQQKTAVKDLTVGSTVTVTGSTASDGSVTATQITQQK